MKYLYKNNIIHKILNDPLNPIKKKAEKVIVDGILLMMTLKYLSNMILKSLVVILPSLSISTYYTTSFSILFILILTYPQQANNCNATNAPPFIIIIIFTSIIQDFVSLLSCKVTTTVSQYTSKTHFSCLRTQ